MARRIPRSIFCGNRDPDCFGRIGFLRKQKGRRKASPSKDFPDLVQNSRCSDISISRWLPIVFFTTPS